MYLIEAQRSLRSTKTKWLHPFQMLCAALEGPLLSFSGQGPTTTPLLQSLMQYSSYVNQTNINRFLPKKRLYFWLREYKSRSLRSWRYRRGFPANGQRTWSNSQTPKRLHNSKHLSLLT